MTSRENLTTKRPPAAAAHGTRLLPFLALAFPALVYYPITRLYFFSDDFLNLFHIANDSLGQYLVTPNGGHVLLARNTIFYAMRQLFGTRPEPYYWSIFLTHLLNVWLLFKVIVRWTRSTPLAVFGAVMWGSSPLHEGTLGWYSVYGHVLVATTLLVILVQAVSDTAPPFSTRCLWYVLALVGATSFGTGIGIAMVLPLALRLLLPTLPGASGKLLSKAEPGLPRAQGYRNTESAHADQFGSAQARPTEARATVFQRLSRRLPPLVSLVIVVPAVYAVLNCSYEHLSGTEAFGPVFPWRLLADPGGIPLYLAHLIAFGLTRLLLGFYSPPWVRPGVWYGILGCTFIAMAVVMRRSERRVRRQLASCTLLLLACYGMVALGRAAFLAHMPLDIVTVLSGFSRYHYVGQLILTIIVCLLIEQLGQVRRTWAPTAALAVFYGVTVAAYLLLGTRIDHHDEARQQTHRVLAAIQSAIEAQPAAQAVYITNQEFPPLPLPPTMFPGWAAAFTIFYPDNAVDGRRVYFVEKKRSVIAAMQRRRRMSTLLVPPSAPPSPGVAR